MYLQGILRLVVVCPKNEPSTNGKLLIGEKTFFCRCVRVLLNISGGKVMRLELLRWADLLDIVSVTSGSCWSYNILTGFYIVGS